MIHFKCTQCGTSVRVKDDLAGKKGKCPQCGTVNQIPAGGEKAPEPAGGNPLEALAAAASAAPAKRRAERPSVPQAEAPPEPRPEPAVEKRPEAPPVESPPPQAPIVEAPEAPPEQAAPIDTGPAVLEAPAPEPARPQARPKAGQAPAPHVGILILAVALGVIAALAVGLAAYLFVSALGTDGLTAALVSVHAVGLLIAGAVLAGLAGVLVCLRAIARNTFHLRSS